MHHPNVLDIGKGEKFATIHHLAHETNWIKYFEKHPETCEKAMKYLEETDLDALPVGKHEIDGDRVFVNVSEYETHEEGEGLLEFHRKYIDLQYVISGRETILFEHIDRTDPAKPYDEAKDMGFVKAKNLSLSLEADPYVFFIFFPYDAHGPGVNRFYQKPEKVKKAIVKIKIEE